MSASQSERGTMADFRTVVAFGAARRITSPAAEVPSVRVRRHPGDLARRGRVPLTRPARHHPYDTAGLRAQGGCRTWW